MVENRRRTVRIDRPTIEIEIKGARYKAKDWGVGGCRLAGYQGDLQLGQEVQAALYFPVPCVRQGQFVNAEVVRIVRAKTAEDCQLALKFNGFSAQDLAEFSAVLDQRKVGPQCAEYGCELCHSA